MFEKLSLFAFKNCKNALFAGKLLAKLLAKMPLRHSSLFASGCFSRDSRKTFCMNFSVSYFCHPHFRGKS